MVWWCCGGLGGVILRCCFCDVKSSCGRVVLWCGVVVFVGKCHREALGRASNTSVGEESCRM